MACWHHRTLALGIAAVFGALAFVQPVEAGEPPTEELARLRSSDAELEDRLEGLENWLAEGRQRLDGLDDQLRQAEVVIEEAEKRADQAARQAALQVLRVQDRAVAAYVHPVRGATVPLSGNVNEAAEQSVLVRQVAAYDREILEAKRDAEERLERAQIGAEVARDDLSATKDEVTALLDELVARRAEAEAAQIALDARIQAVRAEVDSMAAAQLGLTDLIIGLSRDDGTAVGRLLIPVNGTLTSRFGQRWGRLHGGIDIAAGTGTPIRSAAGGRVIYSGWMSGYGNVVVVDHGGRLSTLYAHQSQRWAATGDAVAEGQILGEVGSTGNSTGPHVHFEVRVGGVPVDPIPYLST